MDSISDFRKENRDVQTPSMRLFAYFVLLFFFIFLLSQLLNEIVGIYKLAEFNKIKELVDKAFNLAAGYNEVIVTLFSLFLAFIFILPIAWIYTITKEDELFDPSLVQTIVVLAMAVTGVMIVVGSDLARAFGLAAVVAAVRFRNTLKDTKDAVYVFIAISIGMGCGTEVYHIAVFLSLCMTITMYLLWIVQFGKIFRHQTTPMTVKMKNGSNSKEKTFDKNIKYFYDQSTAEAYQQVGKELEHEIRLMQLVNSVENGDKKKANAVLIIETGDLQKTQQQAEQVLFENDGRWQLAKVISPGNTKATLIYVGRLSKGIIASVLVDTLYTNCTSAITNIELRSFKGVKFSKNSNKPENYDKKTKPVVEES